MAERAAHLVDHVFPAVLVRQWVLTLPHRLRYRLAWDQRPVPRGGPSTMRRAIPSKVEGWSESACGRSSASCGTWPAQPGWLDGRGGAVVLRRRAGPSRAKSRDGHRFLFDPVELLERLAVLTLRRALARPRRSARACGARRRAAPRSGAAPRRCSGCPEPGRRAPLFATRSFDEDTGVSAFDPCA